MIENDSLGDVPAARNEPQVGGTRARFWRLRYRQLRQVHAAWSKARPFLVLPYSAVMLLVLALSGYPASRVLWLAVCSALAAVIVVWEAAIADRGMAESRALAFVCSGIFVQATAISLTGGVLSPMAPLLLGPTIAEALVHGRAREPVRAALITFSLLALMGFLPNEWLGPPIPAPHSTIMAGLTLLYTMGMLSALAASVTNAARIAGERLEVMREDLVKQSLERTRSIEAVSAKVAHELKNPLAAVKALVQLLSSNASDDRSRQRLEVIRSEIARMETIMAEYLTFSRPMLELSPEQVDVAELCDNVIAVLEARANDAGVSLLRSGDSALVVADPRRLKEAVLNLIQNAIEATPRQGTVMVEVSKKGDAAQVVIRDDGKGLSAELLQKVGTPFFTTREGGTGLGVVLARTVVLQHGGQLDYASQEGRGTTVTMSLPAEPPPRADQSLIDVSAVMPSPAGG